MLVVLAILLRRKPEIVLQQAESIRNNPTFHTQERLPVLAWAYGQVPPLSDTPTLKLLASWHICCHSEDNGLATEAPAGVPCARCNALA